MFTVSYTMYSLDFGSQIDIHDGRKRPIDCMGQILMIQTNTVNYELYNV